MGDDAFSSGRCAGAGRGRSDGFCRTARSCACGGGGASRCRRARGRVFAGLDRAASAPLGSTSPGLLSGIESSALIHAPTRCPKPLRGDAGGAVACDPDPGRGSVQAAGRASFGCVFGNCAIDRSASSSVVSRAALRRSVCSTAAPRDGAAQSVSSDQHPGRDTLGGLGGLGIAASCACQPGAYCMRTMVRTLRSRRLSRGPLSFVTTTELPCPLSFSPPPSVLLLGSLCSAAEQASVRSTCS